VYFDPKETRTCFKCNGQGHDLAEVCLSESAGKAESAYKRNTPAQTKARLRALSQELTEAASDRRLFSDEWDDDARGVRTDGRQFEYIPTASRRVRGWWHHDVPSHSSNMTASRCVMLNTRQQVEEFGVGGTDVCLPTTIKWQHCGAPLHSDGRAEEFKKSST